ncbi:MAG: arginase [Marinilabiliales bacterium]|nr:MAG: arginase [Marinilabiliales bacterium]
MNLNDYFDPIELDFIHSKRFELKDQLYKTIQIHTVENNIQAIEGSDIAIVGVVSKTNNSIEGLKKIRESLYSLATFDKTVRIIDLGNIKPGKTNNDQSIALRDVIVELVTLNIIPIIIGNSEDILYANYLAYQKLDKEINLVSIDSKIKISEDRESEYKSALWKIIVENNDSLFSYYNIGYQTHFVNPKILKYLSDQMHFAYRLGYIRSNIKEVEPIFRDADLIGLNISSVRQSDAFGQTLPSPNGYYGEEICQLSRYSGMSIKLSSFGIYDYDTSHDINFQTAQLIAQIIWYFIDGYLNRQKEYPLESEGDYKKFIVTMDKLDHELIFYKSEKTNRWWLEVPSLNKSNYKQVLISCTYDDYLDAGSGDIPQKWLKTFQKLN